MGGAADAGRLNGASPAETTGERPVVAPASSVSTDGWRGEPAARPRRAHGLCPTIEMSDA
jgi:hypothetical protein